MKNIKRNVFIVCSIAGALLIGGGIGTYEAKAKLHGKEADITDLEDEINKLESVREDAEDGKAEAMEDYQSVLDMIDQRDELKSDIVNAEAKLQAREDDFEKVDDDFTKVKSQIKAKETVLKQLTVQVQEKIDDPKILSAGQYTIGIDVPVSRYKATNIGSGSNFVVHSASGDLKVNTILGADGSGDYIFYAEDGDTLITEEAVKLIPIK